MLISAEIHQSFARLHQVAQNLKQNSHALREELVSTIKTTHALVVSNLRSRAWTEGSFGLGGGITHIAGASMGMDPRAVVDALNSLKGITSSRQEASRTELSQEAELQKSHELGVMKDLIQHLGNALDEAMRSSDKISAAESRAYGG